MWVPVKEWELKRDHVDGESGGGMKVSRSATYTLEKGTERCTNDGTDGGCEQGEGGSCQEDGQRMLN
jgi:hypothetical protein